MTIPLTSMNANRIFGRSSLAGMGWRTTASSRPGRFQTRRNASPESLSREAIFEHRPGGTLTQRPGKRPWTTWNTWLTHKLLWTLRTRREGGERESEVGASAPFETLPTLKPRLRSANSQPMCLSRYSKSSRPVVADAACGVAALIHWGRRRPRYLAFSNLRILN